MNENSDIKHVSDTALWVATYRAEESERNDAVFKDPLAAMLVGKRGRAIAAAMPYTKLISWVLVVRTTAIDRLILKAIDNGVDTVMNLGAGLDTRPYRMTLPQDLNWIEVDFPEMIEYKNKTLSGEKPVCKMKRLEADLSKTEDRLKVFQTVAAQSKKVLVITEGVIPYLTPSDAGSLSDAIFGFGEFKYWIQDYRQGGEAITLKRLTKKLKDAPFQFLVKDWLGFFTSRGWKIKEVIYTLAESKRIGRKPPFIFPLSLIYILKYMLSKKSREEGIKASGYVMFGRD